MSLESQIASIHGSMNQDNTAKHVRTDQGQVIERINLRTNSKDGNKNYNEKIKGNLLISKTLPSGTNKVIGWCNDYENDAIIYFIYHHTKSKRELRKIRTILILAGIQKQLKNY